MSLVQHYFVCLCVCAYFVGFVWQLCHLVGSSPQIDKAVSHLSKAMSKYVVYPGEEVMYVMGIIPEM